MTSPRALAIERLHRIQAQLYVEGEALNEPSAREWRDWIEDAIVQLQLGPTSDPEGKLNPDDRGALTVAMTATDGKVIVSFGAPIEWLGLGPTQARAFAAGLLAKAVTAAAQGSTHDGEAAKDSEAPAAAAADAPNADGEGTPGQDPVVDPRD